MIEIIKQGDKPDQIAYVHKCERCNCLFKFTEDSCIHPNGENKWPNLVVKCPSCLIVHNLDVRNKRRE